MIKDKYFLFCLQVHDGTGTMHIGFGVKNILKLFNNIWFEIIHKRSSNICELF